MKLPLIFLVLPLVFPFLCSAEEASDLSRPVLAGPFELEIEMALEKIGGTAASVWFGDRLNVGLDSRSATYFVEGPHVGKVKLLAKHSLEEGVPFRFQALRDKENRLVISVDGKEVYTTKWKGDIGLIKPREWRSKIDLRSVRLQGHLGEAPPEVELVYSIVPITNDGVMTQVGTLKFHTKKPTQVEPVTVTIKGPVQESREWVLRASGERAYGIWIAATPGASLRDRIRVEKLVLDVDGETHSFAPSPSFRLAANIHRRGEADCHTFRIPGIAKALDGSLLAVYDMRYTSRRDLQGHMDIGLSRSVDGGETWAAPVPIMDMGTFGGKPEAENGVSDPNILVDPATGEVIVTALWTHGRPGTHQWVGRGSAPGFGIDTTTQFMAVRSRDHGKTWSELENWTRAVKKDAWYLFAPSPGNGIVLDDGTLVIPSQGRDEKGRPFSNIMYSGDHGKTWTVSEPARGNTTECAVVDLGDGRLMLNMRDNRNRGDKGPTNGRAVGVTSDLGETWAVHPSDHGALPEPVCMASLISHVRPGGVRELFFSNPNSKTARRGMTLRRSCDLGTTWTDQWLLDERGGAYSSLVMVDENTVGILYESSQADLVFQLVEVD